MVRGFKHFLKIDEFKDVALATKEQKECLLLNGEDITDRCGLFCLKPMIYAIWRVDNLNTSEKHTVQITDRNKDVLLCEIYLQKNSELDVNGQAVHFMRVLKAKLNFVDQFGLNFSLLLIHWFGSKNKFNFSYDELKHLVAAYTLPRKVRLVVVEDEELKYVFPMDFHGKDLSADLYYMGLQPSNPTYKIILKVKKWKVYDIPYSKKELLYYCSKNLIRKIENSQPIESLMIDEFKPYRRYSVGLIGHKDMGSHVFIYGNVSEAVEYERSENEVSLSHIHAIYARFRT